MIIGIDPGFSGAIAFLQEKSLTTVDLPTKVYKGKKHIDAVAFTKVVRDHTFNVQVKYVVIEDIGAMPGQGLASTARFTYNAGVLLGVVAALDLNTLKVRPNVWKPALGLNRDKKKSLALARKLFPKNVNDFKLVKHDGRAEAALIAHFAKISFEG